MSWKLTGQPKTQRVTEALARKFSEMEPAPDDRPLSENRLRVYQKIIQEGNFRPCQWAAAYCKETGGTYRVNGKHTSTLMSALDPLPELYATVEYYECDTLHDVSRLYATYDSKMMARNANDIYHSFAACVPDLKNVARRVIERVPGAITYAVYQDEGRSKTQPPDRAEYLLEYPDFAVWVDKIIGSGVTHLGRVPVMAAMFLTYQRAPRIAAEFWAAVRDETGEKPDLPDRKLAKWLLLNSGSVSRRQQSTRIDARYRIRDREYFVKCLHAWNAYREGSGTNLNYHANAKVPDVK